MLSKSPMGFWLLYVWTILSVALLACHAALPSEDYWNSVLPNTPMPKAVTDLLQYSEEWSEDKSTSVNVGKGGVNVNTGKGKSSGGTHVNVGHKGVGVTTGKPGGGTHVNVGRKGVGVNTGKPGGGTHVNVGRKGVGVITGKPGKGTRVGVGKGGINVRTGRKGKPVYVGIHPGPNPFQYRYAANENQLHDNPNVAIFFLETDLHQGTKMNLHFTKSSNEATFLPRQISNTIPFSSSKINSIFNQFSIKPDSIQAEEMKNTIKECEEPGIKGEEKFCATSLESLVDYSTSKLGKNIKAISTEVDKDTQLQEYTTSGVKKMASEKAVVCHRQNYAYALFYCHNTDTTETYMVSLVGADGSKAEAVAVCHSDTSAWNPKHLAFQLLKVKPGTVPICHFLPEDHIVWVSK